jgi:ribA/ribD-fused uncharacterized protein
MENEMRSYDQKTILSMCNAVFGNLTYAYRDVNLASHLAAVYKTGLVIRERGFVDSSAKGGGMSLSHRYLILSSRNRDLSAFDGEGDWGLCNIAPGSFFKVVNITEAEGKTQIALLHIPADTTDFFDRFRTNLEEEVAEAARQNFERHLVCDPVAALESPEWIERVTAPLGMNEEGDLFWHNFTGMTRSGLSGNIEEGEMFDYEVFSDAASLLSQWHHCPFEEEGVRYHSAEQYMIARKARLFDDDAALQKIMDESDFARIKILGRSVEGFEQEVWDDHKIDIVYRANLLKFRQNAEAARALLATGDRILVEVNPHDSVYACGLLPKDERIGDPSAWPGDNILGFVLMDVREVLRRDQD